MLGVFVRRAYAELRSVKVRANRCQAERNQTTSQRTTIDMCALEDRLFYSANPLSALVDVVSDSPKEATELPDHQLIDEDYSDDVADLHDPQSGTWEVTDGRYHATPGSDAISTLLGDQPLPENLELTVTFNADDVSSQYLSNAFVIFDYHGPTDFKFAGAYVGANQWIMGHRSASGWITDARLDASIEALTDHDLRVTIINDSLVTLYADGGPQLTRSYSSSVTDGQLGLGTRDAISRFDDLSVRSLLSDTDASIGDLPLSESFDDMVADHLDPKLGSWLLIDGAYQVSPEMSGDGISTLLLGKDLSDNAEIAVTFNADPRASSRFSNGVIIFDYHSPTDFKYAGGFVGRDEWAIGHRTTAGWVDDVLIRAPLDPFTDYDIRVVVEKGSEVSLYHADTLVASHTFSESVTDGAVGLGTENSITRFDNFSVVDQTPMSDISAVLVEDDLIISGLSGGEVQIVAIQEDTFQIMDHGRLVFTVEGVTGDLHVELGDADDQVTLDLGGYTFQQNVVVNLGGGDNAFQILDGAIGGHLTVDSADGRDDITISDGVTIRKHTRVATGAGDDSFVFSGMIGRGLFLDSGEGDDSLVLSGTINVGFFANTGEGDDRVEILSPCVLGRNATIKLGAGNDSLVSETSQQHMVVLRGYGDDSVSLLGSSSHDRQRDHPKSGEVTLKRSKTAPDVSQAAIVADGHLGRNGKDR
jgi:hypothetical protein